MAAQADRRDVPPFQWAAGDIGDLGFVTEWQPVDPSPAGQEPLGSERGPRR